MWGVKDYALKGEHTMVALRLMQLRRNVRFFFPLDVDELIIASATPDDIVPPDLVLSAAAVRCAIASLAATTNEPRLMYSMFYGTMIVSPNATVADNRYYVRNPAGKDLKKFFRANAVVGLDHGNHIGYVNDGRDNFYQAPFLRAIHAHWRSPMSMWRKAQNDVSAFGYDKQLEPCGFDLCFTGPRISGAAELVKHLEHVVEIKPDLQGVHKIHTLIRFLLHGPMSAVRSADAAEFELPAFSPSGVARRCSRVRFANDVKVG